MTVRIMVLLFVLVIGFAPAPLPKSQRQRKDSGDLTGVWAFTAIEINGVPQPEQMFAKFRIEITKDMFIFDTEGHSEWKLTLDPTASPPSFIWGRKADGQPVYVGSYRYQNGELTMAYTVSGRLQDRPMDFVRPPYKYVFRRSSR